MSDGDDESGTGGDVEQIESQLAAARESLETAATESDLDEVEAELDDVEATIESADLPEPEDEEAEAPRDRLESELADVRDDLEDARGPYAEDVVSEVEDQRATIADGDWTENGHEQLVPVVETFLEAVENTLGTTISTTVSTDIDDMTDALDDAVAAVESADLDADDDADEIAAVLEAASDLQEGVDAAEEWSDLSVRQQLDAEGFYDVLDHRKDYPPEWNAIKVWEKRDRPDMILLAMEKLTSNFMEEHCLEALERMGNEETLEPMLERAEKRDKPAIRTLGNIGSEEALDTLHDYLDADPGLAKTTLRAVGSIGSEESTQAVANRLAAEDESVRSYAARALGRIGDTRAIDPLADVLENDDSDTVRASAAWALNQIGTERALSEVQQYADDRAYLVQAEAKRAA